VTYLHDTTNEVPTLIHPAPSPPQAPPFQFDAPTKFVSGQVLAGGGTLTVAFGGGGVAAGASSESELPPADTVIAQFLVPEL